jgi:hypothetical protein
MFALSCVAQVSEVKFDTNYFRYPLDGVPKLNSNFGEIRPNHYHMGLDLSTGGKENLPIYAVADGYVGRIKIEEGGFGNAIYIYHPNGTSSLYAHLNFYANPISQYVKLQQYKLESWSVDLKPPLNLIPVKKGDLIGYSGNTGASEGPHVHFEIRNAKTDACFNPLLFGFGIQDFLNPIVYKLAVYDANYSIYEQAPIIVPIKVSKKGLTASYIKIQSDKIRIGVMASDLISGFTQKFGIFQTTLFENEKTIAGFKLQEISYEKTRYLNAHVDVQTLKSGKGAFQSLLKSPSDKSGIYTTGLNSIVFPDNLLRNFKLIVSDVAGNKKEVLIQLQRSSSQVKKYFGNRLNEMVPNAINVFETTDLELYLPENCLYDTIHFQYKSVPNSIVGSFSDNHILHTPTVLLQDSFTVRMKANKAIPTGLENNMVMLMNIPGKQIAQKAVLANGMFTSKFRDFGTCYLMLDNIPPVVSGIINNANLSSASQINIFVSDNNKKIKYFRAELDGKFLMFSQRGNRFTYNFDENCGTGEHNLTIIVKDLVGNTTVESVHFKR